MKANKLISLCAAAVMAGGTFAGAQPCDDPASPGFHHGAPDLTAMLTHMLALTDAQKTQVQAKVEAVKPQLDAIHEQAHKQAAVILKQLHDQIRPLLDADQQKRLDAIETLHETRPAGSTSE